MAQPQTNYFETVKQPCKFYGSAKGCRHGANCYYNHDNATTVPLCRNYQNNNCLFGDFCNFRHYYYNDDNVNKDVDELCKYFNSPYGCSRKDKCRFKHIKQAQPKQDDTVRLYSFNELCEMKLNIPQRKWQTFNTKTECVSTITICQFNCLAQSLCAGGSDRITFKCDPKYLIWEYRCKRILFELLQYKCDIICLTEVDKIHFHSFYKPNLLTNNYDGIYLMKNSLNNENNKSHISVQDGLAIFWNTKKIHHLNEKFECILGDKLECCQVALGIRLQLKKDNLSFDVWNTHLKAGRSNESENKRIKQCEILMNFMKKYSKKMPIVLCGDLNLHFEDLINAKGIVVNAKAYNLLTSENEFDEMKQDDDNDDDNKLIFRSIWNNKMNTFSVYSGYKDRDVKACFDYIMVAQDSFVVQEVLSGWEEKEIERFNCRLPNEIYSSDHLLIAAKIGI